MYYSAATGGFYTAEIHGLDSIPGDAVEITLERYQALMGGHCSGRPLQSDAFGHPVLVERPTLSTDYPAQVAAHRYQAETAGITLNDMTQLTDRDSQSRLTAAALAAMIDPAYHCQWKTPAGFVDLNAQQLIDLARAMRAHVQACFDREAELLAHLEAGTFTESMLDEGWPA